MDEWISLTIPSLNSSGTTVVSRDVFTFEVKMKVVESQRGFQEILIGFNPSSEGYAILVDYKLSHENVVIFEKERCLWCPDTGEKNPYSSFPTVYCVFRGESTFETVKNLNFEVKPTTLLPVRNMSEPSGLRKFLVQSGSHRYFINPKPLADLGGTLFEEWNRLYNEGTMETEIGDDGDYRTLLEACSKYDLPIIHSGNYMVIGWCALSIGSAKLLRAVEDFVCSLHSMSPLRKLEISGELRLARLFKEAHHSLGPPVIAHRKVLEYSRKEGIDIDDLHPVLQSVGVITPSDIITI